MMKVRISLSLNEGVVGRIDKLTDGIRNKSRSDTIEKILNNYLSERRTCVILAGGSPDSLKLSGTDIFRPLVKINGGSLIEHIIRNVRRTNYNDIIIVGSQLVLSKIYEVIGNGRSLGVGINYVEEEKPLGSAKTLERVKDFVKSDFLLVACDNFFDFDLNNLTRFHESHDGAATLVLFAKQDEDWSKSSTIIMDGMRIIEYENMPSNPKSNLKAAFIGILSPKVFDYIPSGDINWSLQDNIFPVLAREGRLFGYMIPSEWVNIHSLKDLERIRK